MVAMVKKRAKMFGWFTGKSRQCGFFGIEFKSHLIYSLPKYVLFPILIEWMPIEELCSLDTALCNRIIRQKFLGYIENSTSGGFQGINNKFNEISYLNWI